MKSVAKVSRFGKRAMRWFFWGLLALIFMRGCSSFIKGNTANAVPEEATAKPAVVANQVDVGAGSFAAMFTREYLTFDATGSDRYSSRLAPFLAPSLDRNAGLSPNTVRRSSTVNDAWAFSTKQVAPDRYLVTVVASVTTLPTATKPGSVDQKSTNQAATESAEKAETYYTAVAVPVASVKDEQGGRQYVVWDLPRMVPVPQAPKLRALSQPGEEIRDSQAESLLAGFFKAYAGADGPEAISYFFESRKPIPTLGARYSFVRLNSYQMLKQENGEHVTLAQVELQDKLTQATFRQHYRLILIESNGTWYIRAFEPTISEGEG